MASIASPNVEQWIPPKIFYHLTKRDIMQSFIRSGTMKSINNGGNSLSKKSCQTCPNFVFKERKVIWCSYLVIQLKFCFNQKKKWRKFFILTTFGILTKRKIKNFDINLCIQFLLYCKQACPKWDIIIYWSRTK